MTDNLPAVTEPSMHPDRRALVNPETDSWVAVVEKVAGLAAQIADTEFVPKGLRGKPAAVTAAILYGREIGLPPMTALTGTHVIEGKPASSAELMRALVLADGHEIETLESTGAICKIRGRRKGRENWGATVVWNWDMATKANLTGKDVWKRYPRHMLLARATAELCHRDFPDVIHGMAAAEEYDETADTLTAETAPASPAGTVQRKQRRALPPKTGDGSATSGPTPPGPGQTPTGPSPLPPLPGEPGYQTDLVGPEEIDEHGQERFQETSDGGAGAPPGDTAPQAGADTTPAPPSDPEDQPSAPEPRMMSRGMQRAMFARFGDLEIKDDDERMVMIEQIVGRMPTHNGKPSSNGLTADEGAALMDTLNRAESRDQLVAIITASSEATKPEAGKQT